MVVISFKKVLFLILIDIVSFEKLSNAGLAVKLNTKAQSNKVFVVGTTERSADALRATTGSWLSQSVTRAFVASALLLNGADAAQNVLSSVGSDMAAIQHSHDVFHQESTGGYTEGVAVMIRHEQSEANVQGDLMPFMHAWGSIDMTDAGLSAKGRKMALYGNGSRGKLCAAGVGLQGCGVTEMYHSPFDLAMSTGENSSLTVNLPKCPRPVEFVMHGSLMSRGFATGLAYFAPEILAGMDMSVSDSFREVKGNRLSPDAHPNMSEILKAKSSGNANWLMREQLTAFKNHIEETGLQAEDIEDPHARLAVEAIKALRVEDFEGESPAQRVALTAATPLEDAQKVDYVYSADSQFGTANVLPEPHFELRVDSAIKEVKDHIRKGKVVLIPTHREFVRAFITRIKDDADVHLDVQEEMLDRLSKFQVLDNGAFLKLNLRICGQTGKLIVTDISEPTGKKKSAVNAMVRMGTAGSETFAQARDFARRLFTSQEFDAAQPEEEVQMRKKFIVQTTTGDNESLTTLMGELPGDYYEFAQPTQGISSGGSDECNDCVNVQPVPVIVHEGHSDRRDPAVSASPVDKRFASIGGQADKIAHAADCSLKNVLFGDY